MQQLGGEGRGRRRSGARPAGKPAHWCPAAARHCGEQPVDPSLLCHPPTAQCLHGRARTSAGGSAAAWRSSRSLRSRSSSSSAACGASTGVNWQAGSWRGALVRRDGCATGPVTRPVPQACTGTAHQGQARRGGQVQIRRDGRGDRKMSAHLRREKLFHLLLVYGVVGHQPHALHALHFGTLQIGALLSHEVRVQGGGGGLGARGHGGCGRRQRRLGGGGDGSRLQHLLGLLRHGQSG